MLGAVLVLWIGGQGEPSCEKVFYGERAEHAVSLPKDELTYAIDIAYDDATCTLYALMQSKKTTVVQTWSNKGRSDASWVLPKDVVPYSVLHVRNGVTRIVAHLKADNKPVIVSFLHGPDRVEVDELERSILEYDLSLDSKRVRRVRALMKELNWFSFQGGVAGGHTAEPLATIDVFPVNARPLEPERIAWTPDLRVAAFGWSSSSYAPAVAQREEDGTYRKTELGDVIEKGLSPTIRGPDWRRLDSILVAEGLLVSAVASKRGIDWHAVVWIDLQREGFAILKVEKGRLARKLERFN